MPTLKVIFTGLNLFIEHKDKDQVAVLQPDCLPGDQAPEKMVHADCTRGIPHVGFLKVDLANVGAAVGQKLNGEGIFRFGGHTLDFGFTKSGEVDILELALPDFGKFAPALEVPQDLMPVPAPLLRTVLYGGKISRKADQDFFVPQVLNTSATPAQYKAPFGDFVTWARPLSGDSLTLTLKNFAGTETSVIPLKLANRAETIEITIANVCSENPLGWSAFDPEEELKADEDFKWLYRLLVPPKPYPEMLLGSPFPIPRPDIENPVGVENCIGGVLRERDFSF